MSIVDVRTGGILSQRTFPVEVNELAWSPTSRALLLTTGKGTVDIVAVPFGEGPIGSLEGHTSSCYCIQLDPAATIIAVGGADASVTLWDAAELACMHTITALE